MKTGQWCSKHGNATSISLVNYVEAVNKALFAKYANTPQQDMQSILPEARKIVEDLTNEYRKCSCCHVWLQQETPVVGVHPENQSLYFKLSEKGMKRIQLQMKNVAKTFCPSKLVH